MPEGDTVARIAVVLREALGGQLVRAFASRLPALRDTGLEGHVVTSIETRGKNLLIHFDDGRTLHTHLRMSGQWRIVDANVPPARSALVAIGTSKRTAVLFQRARQGAPPIVKLLSPDALRRDRMLRALGPDVLAETFDVDDAMRRLRASTRPTVAEALLDQRCVAGIGNEYKTELCFLSGIHPHTKPSVVSDDAWRDLLSRARELMQLHMRRAKTGRFAIRGRTTRFGAGSTTWVYGRAGEPCLRCNTRVQRSHDGLDRRSTFWCPTCQRPGP